MRTALITGGSSGIGLELSKQLAEARQWRLLWVSKPATELEQARTSLQEMFPQLEIHTLARDLSLTDGPKAVFEWSRELGFPIDLLVNNAGFGTYGYINEISPEKELTMIHLHICGLYQLTRLFLKEMVERDSGHIINMSSISAFQANPMLTTYGATKSFVLQFSRGLNFELKEQRSAVRVTAVCPTPVKETGFQTNAGMEQTNTFNNWMVVTPEVVAKSIIRSLGSRPDVLIPGRGFSMLRSVLRHLPDRWMMKLSRRHLRTVS